MDLQAYRHKYGKLKPFLTGYYNNNGWLTRGQ
jgi:hypothetical protein